MFSATLSSRRGVSSKAAVQLAENKNKSGTYRARMYLEIFQRVRFPGIWKACSGW